MRLLMNLSRNLFEILRYYFAIDGLKILWKILDEKVSDFMGVRMLIWFKCREYLLKLFVDILLYAHFRLISQYLSFFDF